MSAALPARPRLDRDDFARAREQWSALVAGGEFERALEVVDDALAGWTVETGSASDATLFERARINRAAIAVELGRGPEQAVELRALLMRSPDGENGFLAAYTLARHYELLKEPRKGLFYAQVARDRARRLDDARLGSSLNLMANFLVSESRFDEAIETYARAAEMLRPTVDPQNRLRLAVIGYNAGYCRVVTGDLSGGLAAIYSSLRSLVALGARRHEMLARLDLSFALLEARRAARAAHHAERALALAAAFDDAAARKNALYLSGAAAIARGDEFAARRSFKALQDDFYPEADYLPDLLLRVDVRELVNLKA